MKKKKKKLLRRDRLKKVLGAAQRDQYLSDNPHGYSRSKSVHKDPSVYSRKQKHQKKDRSPSDDGLFLVLVPLRALLTEETLVNC